MRAAPPVQAALDTGGPERMVITMLHALAGAMLATWLAAHAELGLNPATLGTTGAGAIALAAVGGWLARRALPDAAGQLRWDGQAWCLTPGLACAPDRPLQRLVVALDLGLWVLLRLHPVDGGPALWRIASARGAQASWHGLRVALAAHAGAPGRAAEPRLP